MKRNQETKKQKLSDLVAPQSIQDLLPTPKYTPGASETVAAKTQINNVALPDITPNAAAHAITPNPAAQTTIGEPQVTTIGEPQVTNEAVTAGAPTALGEQETAGRQAIQMSNEESKSEESAGKH